MRWFMGDVERDESDTWLCPPCSVDYMREIGDDDGAEALAETLWGGP